MTNTVDNKRIAKNTLMLYIRMLLLMGISLYTSRVVLSTLGVDDFGIYNVVGGIVIVLAFLNTSMAGATQRFMNVELGKGDREGLQKVFSTSLVIHIGISAILLILAETVGIWFLNTYMNIAEERMNAAFWVFQFSILSFIITVIRVPYNAAIISHERMSAFAYISIVEAVLKLLIIYLLVVIPYDRLIVYAALMAGMTLLVSLVYVNYCIRKFSECEFRLRYDKLLLKEMIGFSGWTVFGALGSISHTQGIAIVMNMFFGVVVNAALGIANQVNQVINQFVTNFMTALNPQIVKTYAQADFNSMHNLIKRGSRMGICLVAFFAVPLIIETPVVLNLWLKEVPEYTVTFIRLILIINVCNAFASPLAAAKGATGNIKTYQIILTSLGWLHLPLAWVFFALGYNPYYAMYIYLVLIIIMQYIRIVMVCKDVRMKKADFINDVIVKCLIMIILSSSIPLFTHLFLKENIANPIITMLLGFMSVAWFSFIIVATKEEKKLIIDFAMSKIRKK